MGTKYIENIIYFICVILAVFFLCFGIYVIFTNLTEVFNAWQDGNLFPNCEYLEDKCEEAYCVLNNTDSYSNRYVADMIIIKGECGCSNG